MKIKWHGQSCIVLETLSGVKVMCDPYNPDLGYKFPEDKTDIVTISHNHHDHNAVEYISGNPVIINSIGSFEEKNIQIKGVHTWHDNQQGALRGDNIAYHMEIDNINFVHMGDIGHLLSENQIRELKPCDILAVPIGGNYTIDYAGAKKLVEVLDPQIVIPIHYHTPSNKSNLDSVDKFVGEFLEIKRCRIWNGTRSDIPKHLIAYVFMAIGEK